MTEVPSVRPTLDHRVHVHLNPAAEPPVTITRWDGEEWVECATLEEAQASDPPADGKRMPKGWTP